ncbi:hypothetical protein ACLQ3C_19995 [Gordonia sp. DT30]|uniref:hypothetical protein n=1 Tax=Gordonia sp. DT30 TaxID=3416546 RepID=UPI003CE83F70
MADEISTLDGFIADRIGFDLPPWPGGWPGEIEAALLDAVFSIQARYGSENSGVRAVVKKWKSRSGHGERADDLAALAAVAPTQLAEIVQNNAKASGRLKAEIVVDAATKLSSVGLQHAEDLDNSDAQRKAYLSVKGCGPVTWAYFGMLLGRPDVKADTWILRFVKAALGQTVSPSYAREMIVAIARERGVDATKLDHAIWKYARSSL